MHRLIAVILALALPAGLHAQPDSSPEPPSRPKQRESRGDFERARALERQAFAAINGLDLADAEAALREQLMIEPDNFVPHYNLACVLSMQEKEPDAIESLVKAVERGFVDLATLTTDPQLSGIRDDPKYRALLANWSEVLVRHRDANLATAKSLFRGPKYESAEDPENKLMFYSAFDPGSTAIARREMERVIAWARATVFPDITSVEAGRNDPWVIVVLPERPDYNRWVDREFGPGARSETRTIGGSYSHDAKRLVAMDLGPTLRHEFMHVLHWRDNARRGQIHAEWVQEGLCSLVEDYDFVADGSIKPVPSWRTNMVIKLEKSRGLPTLREFCSTPRGKFTASNPLKNYAIARALFLFLCDKGKLRAWYEAYNETYRHSPEGVAAWEQAFDDEAIEDIDLQFRLWVKSLRPVPEELEDGMASLGLEIDFGRGDGIVIRGFLEGSPGRRSGLRMGDVLTSINDHSTADFYEFIRVLSGYRPGDQVTVTYRRGKLHGSADLVLMER